MLSLKRCRELLGDHEIDDEALKALRQQLYDLAEAIISIHEDESEEGQ